MPHLVKTKSGLDSGLIESPTQSRFKRKCFGTLSSEDTFDGTGNIEAGPWISGGELPGQMNHEFSFVTSIVVSGGGGAICQTISWFSMCSRFYTGWWWRSYVFEYILMSGSGTLGYNKTDQEHSYCDQMSPYMTSFFSIRNVNFQQDNATMS
ncbi:uncharacterized protein TNCV_1466511 [Trichonephila clavipes]|nr:uncharacterized protein TNCV_1466511 [Trichonephila clavipes]